MMDKHQNATKTPEKAIVASHSGNEAYTKATFNKVIAELEAAEEGERNIALNKAAFRLFQFVATDNLDESEVEERLFNAAIGIGLPDNEIEATIESARKAGLQNPDYPPKGIAIIPEQAIATLELSVIGEALAREDVGDAYLLNLMLDGESVYDNAARQWYLWNGKQWEADRKNRLPLRASTLLAYQYNEFLMVKNAEAEKEATETLKNVIAATKNRVKKVHRRRGISDILKLAESMPNLSLAGDEWASEPMELSVANGIIDLKTGQFRDAKPEDYTRADTSAAVEWTGAEPSKRFDDFVLQIMGGDTAKRDFLKRVLGVK